MEERAVIGERWGERQYDILATTANGTLVNSTTLSEDLIFAAAKSVRTSTIILASFNAVAAFATAAYIAHNGYVARRANRSRDARPGSASLILPADVFPFALSIGISIQGIIFAASQAAGLGSLTIDGCASLAVVMLPGMLLIPIIQTVFGVEVAGRALRSKPLPPRSRWTTAVCLLATSALLLAGFLSAVLSRSANTCIGSLFFFLESYAPGISGTLLGMTVIFAACIGIIYFKLSRYTHIDADERIAASRMLYYLTLAIISNAFVLPFFFSLAFLDQTKRLQMNINLCMVAAVVANLSGLLNGCLYLFARSSNFSTVGPCTSVEETQRQKLKGQIRMRSNSDTSSTDGDNWPLTNSARVASLKREDSRRSLLRTHTFPGSNDHRTDSLLKGTLDGPNPLRSNAFSGIDPSAPPPPSKGNLPPRTYSLFPRDPNAPPLAARPINLPSRMSKVAHRFSLRPPSLPFGRSHRRDSSLVSSATVQIGLRLSTMGDIPPTTHKRHSDNPSVTDLRRQTNGTTIVRGPSPLAQATLAPTSPPPPLPLPTLARSTSNSTRRTLDESLRKSLPPPPVRLAPKLEIPKPTIKKVEDLVTLSATVYTPNGSKVKNDSAVNFPQPLRLKEQKPGEKDARSPAVEVETAKKGWV